MATPLRTVSPPPSLAAGATARSSGSVAPAPLEPVTAPRQRGHSVVGPHRPAVGQARGPRLLRAVAPGFTAMVVDQHPLLRESVASRLRAIGARDVVEAGSVQQALERAAALGVRDVCVLDLDLPDGSGVQLLAEL